MGTVNSEQIVEALKILAEKLNTTTEFLWSTLVKQSYVYGATVLVGLATAALFISLWNYLVWKIEPKTEDGLVAFAFCRLFGVFFAALWVVYLLCNMIDITTSLVNPEFFALKQIGRLFIK